MSLKTLNDRLKRDAKAVGEAISSGEDNGRILDADKLMEMREILKSIDTLIMDLEAYFLNIKIRG